MCVCLVPRSSVRLGITVDVYSTAACPGVVPVTACLSVCRGLSLESVCAPGSLGLGSEGGRGEVAAPGGGEGRGRRQWAGAGAGGGAERPGGVCAGGRRRRLSESAQPAPGNIGRLQLLARRGPARPGSAASGKSPAPRVLPRPAAHSAPGGRCTPRGIQAHQRGRLPCPATPPATPHSSLTLSSPPHTYGRPHGIGHPAGPAAASALEFLWGPPRFPSCSRLRVWRHWKTPPAWGGTRAAQVTGARGFRDPSAPAQCPAEARSEAQGSPSRGDSVSIWGERVAQRKPRVIISPTQVS